jgi:hypothetical protein
LTRWIFLRLLGVIYLIAFLSLWAQIEGLVGSNGILPAAEFLDSVQAQIGPERFRLLPTLFWLDVSDVWLNAVCAAGVVLSLLLIVGVLPPLALFLLWLLYLSLVAVGQLFLSFQWDNLLLETGFLAIFFAPWQVWPKFSKLSAPPLAFLWLLRFLLFKLMFLSGAVKLLSGDPTWRNLTALTFHYQTQPLPTWPGWYIHQLPEWFQQSSAVVMFVIELGVPFLIFAPRRWRWGGCLALIALQLLILLTGNYTFFNYLTITLCLLLLDDDLWRRWLPRQVVNLFSPAQPEPEDDPVSPPALHSPACTRMGTPLQAYLLPILAAILFSLSALQTVGMVLPLPNFARQTLAWIAPFRTINNYGLFAVMTTTRPEIIIEGSNDGQTWRAYEFKWKPGDVSRRPGFVAPHQPRLDWQMWFAALGSYQRNLWLINFMARLLEGTPAVTALLETNPFPHQPPRFIRAIVYEYRFTTLGESNWWQRGDPQGLYAPVLSLPQN